MIIVHACTRSIVYACKMNIVHVCTMIIVQAYAMIMVHACTMIIAHACTMVMVHDCTMIIGHAFTIIIVHVSSSTELMFREIEDGEYRGEAPLVSRGGKGQLSPQWCPSNLPYLFNSFRIQNLAPMV